MCNSNNTANHGTSTTSTSHFSLLHSCILSQKRKDEVKVDVKHHNTFKNIMHSSDYIIQLARFARVGYICTKMRFISATSSTTAKNDQLFTCYISAFSLYEYVVRVELVICAILYGRCALYIMCHVFSMEPFINIFTNHTVHR